MFRVQGSVFRVRCSVSFIVTTQQDLRSFRPCHSALVGIDSDGCVFDTMEVKQRKHIHPLIIEHWNLQGIASQVRAAAEFFNLHSRWRGQNRFVELLNVFKALPGMPGVRESGVVLPSCGSLETYLRSGWPLGQPSLAEEVRRTGDPELRRTLDWSLAVNREIDERMEAIPPFRWAVRGLDRIARHADIVVVSQTPEEALRKEWALHGLAALPRVMAGQEVGTKSAHLEMAARDRYSPGKILMIGDAPGDLKAARDNGALFYPIRPGREEESWRRLHDEFFARFLDGTYAGDHERRLIAAFESLLPEKAPWE